MSTFKVKLTPLTPISVSHPVPLLPVESTQQIIPTPTQISDLWRFDKLPSRFPDLPPTPEELNMIFSSHYPVFGSSAQPPRGEHVFPEFESDEYDALVEAFGADKQPFPLALPPELAVELWELTQNMGKLLFSKSEFIPEVQENRFVETTGFEEFAGFGIDFDSDEPPPPSPSENSSDGGHS